jgi:hypothetical protein
MNGKCEGCGGELEYRINGSVQGYFCERCGWAVVTTYIPEIDLDDTKYSVFACGGDYKKDAHVRAVSEVAGVNFLSARKLLQQERPTVFQGRARAVEKVRVVLAEAGLSCEISPSFPYPSNV